MNLLQRKAHKNDRRRDNRGQHFEAIVKENEKFLSYYTTLKLINEDDTPAFLATLREPLPATFRITGTRNHAKELLQCVRTHYFDKMEGTMIEDKAILPPQPIPWYPDELAWQINLTKSTIKTSKEMMKLKKLLVDETALGNFSRQEAVSMIPPLLLDVQPHHYVLDMCAAPGSKTAQLIEFLHQDSSKIIPDGLIIANDADNKRCYMLVHQSKRLNSPCFMITNYDASTMPNIYISKDGISKNIPIVYDRILCDVPCSGDGTLRKNIMLWKRWNQNNALSLHCLQLRILIRGVELLARDGILVYSTCSFNPIENEAIIAALLKKAGGSIKLVDVSDKLPALKRRSGMNTWKVLSKQGNWYNNFSDVPVSDSAMIKPSMFPPSESEAQEMHLDRCLRILPQDQNTGGFFVAVLQKVDHLTWLSKSKSVQAITQIPEVKSKTEDVTVDDPAKKQPPQGMTNNSEDEAKEPPSKKAKGNFKNSFKEDPYVFISEADPIWPDIRDFYKMEHPFPIDLVFTRTKIGKKRTLYLASSAIKNILENNDTLRVINTGVKIFSRSESPHVHCSFRINQEGIEYIYPYVQHRKISLTKEDVIVFLTQNNPLDVRFSPSTHGQLLKTSMNCLDLSQSEDATETNGFIICGWKGKFSVRPLIPKPDHTHYLLLCGEVGLANEPNQAILESSTEEAANISALTEVSSELDEMVTPES
ncbi:uncharacterized protein TRIADDRAFT_19981 [Trichoplax adhaerens]|uniref:tRNA (cytosine(34)-C(5))-methyltransferase n=1 Tax=Trichoplax adhaerens TaxID=10228 RepID=B3RJG2_TRIAD|nr:hypothetical protein TRIADDRAFT_19981 [Trichoplax adhaerens]EDV29090.1 hypothetical protein TRIADDRAFT_19981 [Trichoplax adhaerens]|eukprot:XP_002108292.1 hypothetical protein TRIADDRAFT_19981 [Trichoplax adhaerens]